MIKSLLQIKPSRRPDCIQILKMEIVEKNLTETFSILKTENPLRNGNFLKSIKVTANKSSLSRNLPKPNYSFPSYLRKLI